MFMRIGFALVGLVGKTVSDKTAKIIGIALSILVLVGLLMVAKCSYDRSLIEDYKQERQGEIDRGVLKADREAGADKAERDQNFANSQTNVQGSVTNAIQTDPNHGAAPVGPVQQSYFDELRRQQRNSSTRR